ncbi:hypothetical protein [Anaerobium acetethylicum]|uniref:Uncharacterized protein n=1 Tax=Anaerobium acetethylicum TaxID=1619234 RepID=A0A1D3TVJ3_9FIRM|nr:hypothetical protein [Anaerobium acetethylicum]SCP98169.1 hypothetical protein SAMN05421730_101741 [Anaerobium acetethylicum]
MKANRADYRKQIISNSNSVASKLNSCCMCMCCKQMNIFVSGQMLCFRGDKMGAFL